MLMSEYHKATWPVDGPFSIDQSRNAFNSRKKFIYGTYFSMRLVTVAGSLNLRRYLVQDLVCYTDCVFDLPICPA